MGYLDSNLMTGESVVYRTSIHWITLFLRPAIWMLLGIIFLVPSGGIRILGGLFIIAWCLDFLGKLIVLKTSEFGVTNKRIIMKTGLIRRRTCEMLLNKIETVNVNQDIGGRIIGYGTIAIRGTGGSLEVFHNIAQPMAFRTKAHEQIEALAGGKA